MTKRRSLLMNYLLSLLVMAWGILPPALRHAHEGGDDASHRHAAQAAIGEPHDGHHHPHANEHGHSQAGNDAPALAKDWVVHAHWTLLGFEFSVPTPGSRDVPKDPRAAEAVLVRLVDDLPTMSLRGNYSLGLDSLTWREPTAPVVCPTLCPSRPSNPISSLPLCDSARFERSGVLLA